MTRYSSVFLVGILLLASCAPQKPASHPEQEAILEPVRALFDGMRAGDSTMVASAFLTRAPFFGTIVTNKEGQVRVAASDLPSFLQRIAEPRDAVLDERLFDIRVESDGTMAMAWTPYRFYVGEQFSHCGVNVFTLAKTSSGWKITAVTDTRRKEPCPE